MDTMQICCPRCGRHVQEGKCCEREAWLVRRRELLNSILAGMGVRLKAAGSTVMLADAASGHAVILNWEVDDDETGAPLCGAGAHA